MTMCSKWVPGALHRCVREKGHKGQCVTTFDAPRVDDGVAAMTMCVCGERLVADGHPDLCRKGDCCLDRGDDWRMSPTVLEWRDRIREQRAYAMSRLQMGFEK